MILKRSKKKPSKPVKEHKKDVPAKRFNEMIDYYTTELKSRLKEIGRMREEAAAVVGLSVKHAGEKQELQETIKRLQSENSILKNRIREQQ